MQDSCISLIVLLPTEKWNMAGVLRVLDYTNPIEQVLAKLTDENVNLKLPRLNVSTVTDLFPVYKAMGLTEIFLKSVQDTGESVARE